MSVQSQLGALSPDALVSGRNTLHRAFIHGSGVSSNVTPVNLIAVKSVDSDKVSYERAERYYQQGGGDDPLMWNVGPSHGVRITVYAGQMPAFLASLMGVATFGTSGYAAQNLTFDSLARFDTESIFRKKDNYTHKFSVVHQDLIIQPFAMNSAMEDNDAVLEAMSFHDPVILAPGAEVVYSQFTGDGSTTSFTLPYTPLNLRDIAVGNADDWFLEKLIYVKLKATTDSQGTRQKSGASLTGSNLIFTTAPAAGTIVQTLGAKATA